MDELYGGNLSESDGIDGLELLESFDEPDLSEVPELSDDLGGSLVIEDVSAGFSEEDCLCLAVIMPQITKMIITQYMNIMRICLLEKRKSGLCICMKDNQIISKNIEEALIEKNENHDRLCQLFLDLA